MEITQISGETFMIKTISRRGTLENSTATTHIKRQLVSGDNSYQFGKATTHINQNSYRKTKIGIRKFINLKM